MSKTNQEENIKKEPREGNNAKNWIHIYPDKDKIKKIIWIN